MITSYSISNKNIQLYLKQSVGISSCAFHIYFYSNSIWYNFTVSFIHSIQQAWHFGFMALDQETEFLCAISGYFCYFLLAKGHFSAWKPMMHIEGFLLIYTRWCLFEQLSNHDYHFMNMCLILHSIFCHRTIYFVIAHLF